MTDTDTTHRHRIEAERINTALDPVSPWVSWLAWRGDWDLDTRYGRGATEQAAIDELLELEA